MFNDEVVKMRDSLVGGVKLRRVELGYNQVELVRSFVSSVGRG